MRRSADRILTSHVGVLPRPPALEAALAAEGPSPAEPERSLSAAVGQVVARQRDIGIDVVNDGEYSKPEGFSRYVTERIGGIEPSEPGPGDTRRHPDARDRRDFPGFYSRAPERAVGFRRPAGFGARRAWTCTGPLSYIGHERVRADIDRLRAASGGTDAEPFLTAVAPGTIEHWLSNEHYADDESFLMAIAVAMRVEYKAVTDAGIVLQIDDPDLPDGWQMHPEMDLAAYRSHAALRIAALNHALSGIPEELVRLHVCWGSYHGPHKNDIPLAAITDLILSVPAACYSIEGANPVHEHEWQVWQDVPLPEGKLLMPGMVSHCTDLIEHPDLVAQRIVRMAKVIGRENLIAGTDCGLGHRVGHPEICWAKLEALVEGARRASCELWHR